MPYGAQRCITVSRKSPARKLWRDNTGSVKPKSMTDWTRSHKYLVSESTGLTLSSGGVLSGTPTTAGSYSFTVQVTDSAGDTYTCTYSITVYGQISITTTSLPNGTVSVSYSASLAGRRRLGQLHLVGHRPAQLP